MHTVGLFSAVLAVAGLASAQSTCSDDITVTQPTPIIKCDVVDANINVDPTVGGTLSIEGPKKITKDLIINNATQLISITSSSITEIGGTLRLQGLELLNSFNMLSLKSVNKLELTKLNQLSGLTLGTSGVTKATSISILDTFISDLSNLNVAKADNITIANNRRLNSFSSKIEEVKYTMSVVDNAGSMQVKLANLESAGVLDFRSIQSFDAPILESAGRVSFQDSPDLQSVSANNLSSVKNSLTLANNKKLTNISFTALKTIGGDLTVNNTGIMKINKFPELKSIGSVLLAGIFNTVEIPKLDDIQGSVTVTSTTDISEFCGFFKDLKTKGLIRGIEKCTSNNAKAVSGGEGGTSGGKNSTGDSGAMSLGVNSAMLGFAAVAGFAQLF
ncbi:cell wall protein Ecm33 [Conoideocrella luteorostrata]|uniref:Cell wall protein Ecm33 n=1 Tax=Conoideocrella luteorostrata TaxID=1105319 RepID=A0AAJ0CJW8_9HYPO|nr:cell wall protein Ecm33 [Conoideocrella luteorostrata]